MKTRKLAAIFTILTALSESYAVEKIDLIKDSLQTITNKHADQLGSNVPWSDILHNGRIPCDKVRNKVWKYVGNIDRTTVVLTANSVRLYPLMRSLKFSENCRTVEQVSRPLFFDFAPRADPDARNGENFENEAVCFGIDRYLGR